MNSYIWKVHMLRQAQHEDLVLSLSKDESAQMSGGIKAFLSEIKIYSAIKKVTNSRNGVRSVILEVDQGVHSGDGRSCQLIPPDE